MVICHEVHAEIFLGQGYRRPKHAEVVAYMRVAGGLDAR